MTKSTAAQVDISELAREYEASMLEHGPSLVLVMAYVDALRSSATASEKQMHEALKRYGWHGGGSPMCERIKGSGYPCTCGLDAILAKGETK